MTDTAGLWAAVDALTLPTRTRLTRDDGSQETVTLEPLWDQLVDAVVSGQGAQGRGKQTSKPPLDTEAVSLKLVIEGTVSDACMSYMLDRTHTVNGDLRRLASSVLRLMDDDLTGWWTETVAKWCRDIRRVISADTDRPWSLHGQHCPDCHAKTIHDEEGQRRPAITVTWRGGLVRAVECGACGQAWFRGPDLDRLVEQLAGETGGVEGLTA